MQQRSKPAVCVVIAAYDCEHTIVRAIASALAEPEVAEVVVVDDASTDNTVTIAHTADDGTNRLKILVQPCNSGPSSARNRAIKESSSPWIAILDADDFFLPGRIKGLLPFVENADLIADDMWQVSENDINGPKRGLLEPAITAPHTVSFAEFVLSNVTRRGRNRGELGFIKPLMRREFLEAHRVMYQVHMHLGEDYELYARALALGARLLLVPAKGYVSVMRANSLSGRHSETDLLHLRECDNTLIKEHRLSKADRSVLRQHYSSIDCRLQWRMLILAVKDRNIMNAIATFIRPYPVPVYLCVQLACQVYMRSCSIMKHRKHG